jgi:hypothetical protein
MAEESVHLHNPINRLKLVDLLASQLKPNFKNDEKMQKGKQRLKNGDYTFRT